MSSPLTNAPRWFSVDSDHDLSSTEVDFSLDEVIWDTGTHGNPPQDVQDQKELEEPIEAGFDRFWWYVNMGPSSTIIPTAFGNAIVHGKVKDNPSEYRLKWQVYFRYE